MSARLLIALAALPASLASAAPAPTAPWEAHVSEAADRFAIPPAWIRAVMLAESGGVATVDGRAIRSRAGALGLMQVMPATYAAMATRYGLGRDPGDPHDNILAGAAYLRLMYDRFGAPGFLAAYNAGPNRYADHLATGQPLPSETRAYVARLSARLAMPSSTPEETVPDTLFVKPARVGTGELFFALKSGAPRDEASNHDQ